MADGEPIDLRRQGAPAGDSDLTEVLSPKSEAYDPAADRENIRGRIAMWLVKALVALVGVVALIGLITAAFCGYTGGCNADTVELKSVRGIVELILTPLVGLVGAVTGFYFGEKSTASRRSEDE